MDLKRCVTCLLEKPLSEFNKHASQEDGHSYYCRGCNKIRKKAIYERDKEMILADMREKRWEGRPKRQAAALVAMICQQCGSGYQVKPYRVSKTKFCSRRCTMIASRPAFEEKRKAGVAAVVPPKQPKEVRAAKKKVIGEKYYEANKEALRLKAKAYYEANKPLFRAARAEYEAAKIRAIPSWADFEKIEAFYLEANRLTIETGIQHDVDHIYPLNSKIMCGLHVETNLQILTSTANRKKSNSIPETDTPCLTPKMRLRTEKPTGPQMELPLTKEQRDRRRRRKKRFLKSKARTNIITI